jgi:two-component system response regulator FixJ
MSNPIVHVIDDDDSAREALIFLLESGDVVVRAYASAPAFLDALPTIDAGIVVSDIRMPEMSGLELERRLGPMSDRFPVIIMTGHGDIPMAVEAMRGGVIDFLEKPFSEERIFAALDRARAVLACDDAATEDAGANAELAARIETLSERERQVLERVVTGQPNKLIARDLDISPRTVEIYRSKLMTKMKADSLAGLVRMALAAEAARKPRP